MLHVIYDDRIWPSFLDSSSKRISEKIYIDSISDVYELSKTLVIDDTVTIVTFKQKTIQNVLTEVAGLLVILRIFTFISGIFHE